MSPAAISDISPMCQYVALRKGGPFQLIDGAYPTPGPDEICIRNRAVALNQLDVKSLDHGMMVKRFPEIFGIDAAGVVEVVGANVTAFKAGDAVMSSAGLGGRKAAFQDVTTVPAHFASRKPANWSFSQACCVPIIYLTAAAAITKGLNTPLPHLQSRLAASAKQARKGGGGPEEESAEYLPEKPFRTPSLGGLALAIADAPPPPPLRSVLVLGGSSGVGASAIQLLRLALPEGATILSTNSPRHNKRLIALGATACIDRHLDSQSLARAIGDASPQGMGVDAIIDAVAAAAEDQGVFRTLRSEEEGGPMLYAHVFTGRDLEKEGLIPEEVKATRVFGHLMFVTPDGDLSAMNRLADLVDEGSFRLPLEVEVVGSGLEGIGPGLERLREGVSGTKLVVAL